MASAYLKKLGAAKQWNIFDERIDYKNITFDAWISVFNILIAIKHIDSFIQMKPWLLLFSIWNKK